ncbi:GNAT family N-acetyltransferase [Mesorhizobium sp. M0814]|uniref:GNAT family N-acetyltransferase n=1 Tax=Mesorhizobium sp. M0814 TaxID=2957004 RepID=UPI00333AC900
MIVRTVIIIPPTIRRLNYTSKVNGSTDIGTGQRVRRHHRLVAVTEGEQGKGHGRNLNSLVEAEAGRRGVKTLRFNSAPEALGYYEKMGWRRASWDKNELVGLAKNCIEMFKEL